LTFANEKKCLPLNRFYIVKEGINVNKINTDEIAEIVYSHKFVHFLRLFVQCSDKKFGTTSTGVCRFTIWDVYTL
jgi:hypothetical protein